MLGQLRGRRHRQRLLQRRAGRLVGHAWRVRSHSRLPAVRLLCGSADRRAARRSEGPRWKRSGCRFVRQNLRRAFHWVTQNISNDRDRENTSSLPITTNATTYPRRNDGLPAHKSRRAWRLSSMDAAWVAVLTRPCTRSAARGAAAREPPSASGGAVGRHQPKRHPAAGTVRVPVAGLSPITRAITPDGLCCK